jgi:carbamate kinase
LEKLAVVALGGNALIREGQSGTHADQEANALIMAQSVCSLLRAGWRVAVVHGNGPQVGNLAIQQEEAESRVPAQPLFSLGSMTQGQLGSLICLALHRVSDVLAVSLVTHVVVAPDDPAFQNPTKPIGPFLSAAEAAELARTRGWTVKEDSGRGYRRVVPSPEPLRIVEAAAIQALAEQGMVVVAAGGGGIPVVASDAGYRGVDAVIDKDYAAQSLATALNAEALVLVTGVDAVMLDYGTPSQRPLGDLVLDEAEEYLAQGQFLEGSMGPKVRAATRFLASGGEVAIITSPELVDASLLGMTSPRGTRILRMPPVAELAS